MTNGKTDKRFRLRNEVSASWQDIAIRLEFEPDQLEDLDSNVKYNKDRIQKVFNCWFINAPDEYPLSWKGLHDILRDVNRIDVASKYFDFLCMCDDQKKL